jgi:hypothetical protein
MRRCVMFLCTPRPVCRDQVFYVKSGPDAPKDVAGRVAGNYTQAARALQRIIARILRKQRVRRADAQERRRRNGVSR